MKILFDTSVLVAALLTNHSNHSLAFPSLKAAQRREIRGYISAHSLAELYSVLTRLPEPLRVSTEEAQALIVDLSGYLEVVSLQAEDYKAAIAQMVMLKLPGGGIFDALIAQAALKTKVNHLVKGTSKGSQKEGLMGSKRSKDASSTSSTQQRDYLNCEISFGRCSAGKIPWELELSTLPWHEGRSLWAVDDLTVDLDREYVTQIVGDNAAPQVRRWKIWEWSNRDSMTEWAISP